MVAARAFFTESTVEDAVHWAGGRMSNYFLDTNMVSKLTKLTIRNFKHLE